MGKKVLVLASNVGLWAEELQAPWDALTRAGHELTLATHRGLTPLPITISMDPEFIDPLQNYKVNPVEVVERTKALLESGAWDNPLKIENVKMSDYDAIVLVGGPGSALDLVGNADVHNLVLDAYQNEKMIGALCYAVGALVWTRDPRTRKSIIHQRTVAAHPREWDFNVDMTYPLYGATPENPGTDLITKGFVFPLQVVVEDAVGETGSVRSDPMTNRERPLVAVDWPFVTALSVESSIAFGEALASCLDER
jgi:putative intracellular protease/amidase